MSPFFCNVRGNQPPSLLGMMKGTLLARDNLLLLGLDGLDGVLSPHQ
jgi:hypothetical protein